MNYKEKLFNMLFPNKREEFNNLVLENKRIKKENIGIKKYISEMRANALKEHGGNTHLLVFIQKLEESFTWINQYK